MAVKPVTDPAKPVLSETAYLAAFPFLGYAYAFAFEVGFGSRYHIPIWTIRLSLLHVIVVMGVFLLALSVIVQLAQQLPHGPYRGIFAFAIEIVFFATLAWKTLVLLNWHLWVVRIAGGLYALLVLRLIASIFYFRVIKPVRERKGTWLERWAADRMEIVMRRPPDLHSRFFEAGEQIGLSATAQLRVYILLAAMPMVSFWLGSLAASRQVEFDVAHTPSECVVLRSYGESVICAPFDRASRLVQRSFRIVPSAEITTAYSNEILGQLSLAPMSAADSAALTVGVPDIFRPRSR